MNAGQAVPTALTFCNKFEGTNTAYSATIAIRLFPGREMKTVKLAVFLVAALAGAAFADSADARRFRHHHHHHHGGGVRFGLFIGAPVVPYYSRYYYPPAYYPYYAPTVVAPSAPVYVEQSPQPVQNSWYYCHDSQTYYPYVQQCASPWQQVAPQ